MITVVSLNPALDKVYFIDEFKAGSMFRVKNIIKSPGGKGINVSRVLSILGAKVYAAGFIAGDTGRWISDSLASRGIKSRFIQVDGETRTNINIIDKAGMTETEILEFGPYIKESDMDQFLTDFKTVLESTSVLVCTGGLPEGIPVEFYKILIDMAKPLGVVTILDASGDALKEGIKAGPNFIKPNTRELSQASGKSIRGKEDIINACSDILNSGVGSVIASMGADGALLVDRYSKIHAKPPKVEVVNAIGSGDSMTAGVALSIIQGYSRDDMMRFATACAVSNTQFTEIGMVCGKSVEQLMKDCTLEYL
ncbi:MAG TPA: 1-phosphofructokinase [Pseudobacteroides sp.]|uniref:1-phosphofructokinase n=1 Tax=Pseudobacteroides sp. TaxID=1968840 RepID=UPI002F951506